MRAPLHADGIDLRELWGEGVGWRRDADAGYAYHLSLPGDCRAAPAVLIFDFLLYIILALVVVAFIFWMIEP